MDKPERAMKKNLKKLLVGCFALLLHTACAVTHNQVTGFNEQMTVLKERFPELYDLHSQGKIVIWDMWRHEKRANEPDEKRYSVVYIQNGIRKSYSE